MTSRHYEIDRITREELIKMIGYGKIVKSVEIDRGHKNGPEIHEISSTGIVTIYNKFSHKMITKLIARPGQIMRYYKNEKAPAELIKLAREHQQMNFNYL